MRKRFLWCFAVLALGLASAKSYNVRLFVPAMAGNTELKAGEYQLEVVDQKAVLRNGKVESETPVKVETNGAKYGTTTVRFLDTGGKMRIQEIHLGGTKTKLVFAE
ncbi:MAG TPA: hypothetical protein VKU19_15440 [Bryobacteraceae bacterium]|nr:hypothetical protein [Bryobacteraceae bacterium]